MNLRRSRTALGAALVATAAITAGIAAGIVSTPNRTDALPGPDESTVVAVEPTRVLDTRIGLGLSGSLESGVSQTLAVTGSIPTQTGVAIANQVVIPDGANGVVLNVTALRSTGSGFISVRPGDATGAPTTSNLNFPAGVSIPNAVTVALPATGSAAGSIDIHYGQAPAGSTTDVLIDIVAYTTSEGLADLTTRVLNLESSLDETGRTIDVGSDGTALENGAAFAAAVGQASLLDPTASAPVVIRLGPGRYEMDDIVELPAFVQLEGAGTRATEVTCACPTLRLDGAATIKDITIATTGNVFMGSASYAIDSRNDDLRLESARVTSSGSSHSTVNLSQGGQAVVIGSTIEKSNIAGTNGTGFDLDGGATLRLVNSEVHVVGSTVEAIAAESSAVDIIDSVITTTNGTALFTCCQEAGETSTWTIDGSVITAGGTSPAIATNSTSSTISVHDSRITGNAVTVISSSTPAQVTLRHSTVLGGGVTPGATCVAIATESSFLPDTCPVP